MIRFAKAVFCFGVGSWYVRLGSEHGKDFMFLCPSKLNAKLSAKIINASLNRDLEAKKKRKNRHR